MHGVEAPAVHALEHDEIAAAVGDRDRDRDAGLLGLSDGGGHHLARPGERQALGVRDVHRNPPGGAARFCGGDAERYANAPTTAPATISHNGCRRVTDASTVDTIAVA